MDAAAARTDTIAAIATAPGPAAIGIIRISGPQSRDIVSALLPGLPARLEPRKVHTGWAVDPHSGERIDRVVAFVFDGASSYTGEPSAEIQGHGGPVVMDALLAAVLNAGALPAGPGEFTRRAFLNGRLDLAQAEAVALLVSARCERAARASIHQLAGGLDQTLEAARAPLVEALVSLEGSLDFAEHEVPGPDHGVIAGHLELSRRSLTRLLGTWNSSRRIFDGIRVVLAGPPNAGKSSLFNRILGRERALVDEEPGTTRDYLEASARIDGLRLTLVDTAGLRTMARSIESRGIEMSRQAIASADVILLVVDASGMDAASLDDLTSISGNVPIVVAQNKMDLENRPHGHTRAAVGAFPGFEVSALTGEGVQPLIAHLVGDVTSEAGTRDAVLSCTRHRDLVTRAIADIDRGASAIRQGHPSDILASTVREAVGRIDEITGRDVVEEVLDTIFSSFCVGK